MRELVEVQESAAWLQELVPEATLVGGTAAALYAAHRGGAPGLSRTGRADGWTRRRLREPHLPQPDHRPCRSGATWPTEAIHTALERGAIGEWRRINAEIRKA